MTRRMNNNSSFNKAFVAGSKSNIINLARMYIEANMRYTRIEGTTFTHRIESECGGYSAIRLVRSRRKTWARLSIVDIDGWHVQEDITQLQLEQLDCYIKHHNRELDEKIKMLEESLPLEISALRDISNGNIDYALKHTATYLEEISPRFNDTYVRNMRHLLSEDGKRHADMFITAATEARSYAEGFRRGVKYNSNSDVMLAVRKA